MKRLHSKKGFTMMEIIIVLVIMAILIGATVPSLMGFVKEARGKAHLETARAGYSAAQAAIMQFPVSVPINNGPLTGDTETQWKRLFESTADIYSNFSFTTSETSILKTTYTSDNGYLVTIDHQTGVTNVTSAPAPAPSPSN